MIQLLLHLWGDYITQNDWMANNKTKNTLNGWLAVITHVTIYSLPFLFIGSLESVFIIWVTHLFMDKFRLANHLIRLKNWRFTPNGFPEGTPPFMSVWLMIIIDNTIHVTINYLSLYYL